MVNIFKTLAVAALCLLQAGTTLASPYVWVNASVDAHRIFVPDKPHNTTSPTIYCRVGWARLTWSPVDIYIKNFKNFRKDDLDHGKNALKDLLVSQCHAHNMNWDHLHDDLGWDEHLHLRTGLFKGGHCVAKQIIAAGLPNPAPDFPKKPWKNYCKGIQHPFP